MKSILHFSALTGEKLSENSGDFANKLKDQLDNVADIREHDVTYYVRVSIDLKIHVGLWYDVQFKGSSVPPVITKRSDLLERPVSLSLYTVLTLIASQKFSKYILTYFRRLLFNAYWTLT